MKRLIVSETEKNNIKKLYESKGIFLNEQNKPNQKNTATPSTRSTFGGGSCPDPNSNKLIINDILANKRPLNTLYINKNIPKSILAVLTPEKNNQGSFSSNIYRYTISDNGYCTFSYGIINIEPSTDVSQITDLNTGVTLCGSPNHDVENKGSQTASNPIDLYNTYIQINDKIPTTPENFVNFVKTANPKAGEVLTKTMNPPREVFNNQSVKNLYGYIQGLRGQTQQSNQPKPTNQNVR